MNCLRGYSFIELLLAVLIFSLGAMAIAAMQLNAVQATRSASDAGAALLLAEDLLQRVLATPGAAAVYAQALQSDAAGDGEDATCAPAETCAALVSARDDIAAWQQLVDQRPLAATRACVARAPGALQVSVSWIDRGGRGATLDVACRGDGDDAETGRRSVTLSAPLESLP